MMLLPALLTAVMLVAPGEEPFRYLEEPAAAGRPRVLLAPRRDPEATMVVTYAVGSVDDGSTPGITRLAQRAVLEANRRANHEALVTALHRAGASLRSEVGFHECRFTLTAPRQEFPRLARAVLGLLLAPELDRSRFRASVERTRRDQREPGRPDALVAMLASTVGNDDAYKADFYGDVAVVDMIGPARVSAHLARWMTPANATVVLAGGFDAGEARRMLTRFRGGVRHPVTPLRFDLPVSSSARSSSETHVVAHPFRLENQRQAASLRLLVEVLRRRVERRARTLGMSYSAQVVAWHSAWADLLILVLPVRAQPRSNAGALLAEELAALGASPLAADELERGRAAALARLRAIDASPGALAAVLAAGSGTDWYGAEVAGALGSLGADELQASAADWLRSSRRISLLFSPEGPPRIIEMPLVGGSW